MVRILLPPAASLVQTGLMDAGGERTRAGLRRQKRADAAGGVEAAEVPYRGS